MPGPPGRDRGGGGGGRRPSCWLQPTRRWRPLRQQHAAELAALADQAEAMGAKGIPGRRQVEEGHKREERRWRTDDLRFGLATLAEVYRDRLVATVGADEGEPSSGRARPKVGGPCDRWRPSGKRRRPSAATPTSRC